MKTAIAWMLFAAVAGLGAHADNAPPSCAGELADDAVPEGAIVGEIVLDTRQIFDTSLPEENKKLYRLANRYHVLTRPATIRNQLLFAPGDAYSKQKIEESERILRRRSYLIEVSVFPFRSADGKVDICVSTRDTWTLLPGFSFERSGGENETSVSLEDVNIAGTGAELGVRYSSDAERDSIRVSYVPL